MNDKSMLSHIQIRNRIIDKYELKTNYPSLIDDENCENQRVT